MQLKHYNAYLIRCPFIALSASWECLFLNFMRLELSLNFLFAHFSRLFTRKKALNSLFISLGSREPPPWTVIIGTPLEYGRVTCKKRGGTQWNIDSGGTCHVPRSVTKRMCSIFEELVNECWRHERALLRSIYRLY